MVACWMMMSLSRLLLLWPAQLGGLGYKEGTPAKLEVSPQLGDTQGSEVLTYNFPLPLPAPPRSAGHTPTSPDAAICQGSWCSQRAEAHGEPGVGCRVWDHGSWRL